MQAEQTGMPDWRGRLLQVLRRFALARGGGIAVTFALSLPAVVVLAGVASDYAIMTKLRSELQDIADAAAMAGAREVPLANADPKHVGNAARTFAIYRLMGDGAGSTDTSLDGRIAIDVEVAKDLSTVKVDIREDWAPFFAHFVSKTVTPVRVSAVARFVGRSNICALGLSKYKTAIDVDASARLTANRCGIFSNSRDSNSLRIAQAATVRASMICSAGGASISSSASVSPKVLTDCPVLEDPLANRPPPEVGPCKQKNMVVDGKTVSLDPGVYCGGVTIKGNAKVTLNPGVYVIKDGGFVVMNTASVRGEGVGFYVTGKAAGFNFTTDTQVSLSAPISGPLAGLLIFEDRSMQVSITHKISSNDARRLIGTLYLPVGNLLIDAKEPVADQSAYTAILAKSMELRSGPNLILNSDYEKTDVPVPAGIAGSSQVILSQ